MKTIIALAIIGYALAAQGNPPEASYCMGNNDDLTTCSACYNYTLGTIGARIKVGSTCTTLVTSDATVNVTDCLWYTTTVTANTRALTDCGQCNAKTWMNITATNGALAVACSNTAIEVAATNCNTTTAIADCDQLYCLLANGGGYSRGCRRCGAQKAIGAVTTAVGATTCDGTRVANCEYGDPITAANCYQCSSNFALNQVDATTCTAFTTDAGCRLLGNNTAGSYYCGQCKTNYYFNLLVCKLGYDASTATTGANLMAISAAVIALAVFFN